MISPTVFEDGPSLHKAAADRFLEISQQAIALHGTFHVALSGGSTPKFLFQLLAGSPYLDEIDWPNVHIYFGDERFVPHSHDDSNYKMAKQYLLNHVSILAENIYPVPTELATPQLAADSYQAQLVRQLTQNEHAIPQFDLVLLGLGPDGHTASLFPDTNILRQYDKYCDAVHVQKFDSWRISITFPIINHAKNILLLSEGEGKANIVQQLIHSQKPDRPFPIQMIKPENQMFWYIDQAAAANID